MAVYLTFFAVIGLDIGMNWIAAIFGVTLIWISVVDFESYEIPDLASLLLVSGGLTYVFLWQPDQIWIRILGAIFWFGLFYLTAEFYRRFRGWHGLGFGDVKLVAGLALWVGLQSMVYVVLAAAVSGILVILAVIMWMLH